MKAKRPYADMRRLADALVDRLSPVCARIEIAGSIRRKQAEIGDIELLAVPFPVLDLFEQPTGQTEVDLLLAQWPVEVIKNGEKYKQFIVTSTHGHPVQVDLFLQPDPATWGVNMLIRTGPANFSKKMVTPKRSGGWMPDAYTVRDARIWLPYERLETPEEEDIFRLYGLEYIEPEYRR